MLKKWIVSLLLAFSLSTFAAFAADKININTASADELQLLDGVGPSTANAIVQYREQNGAFASVEDLVNIKEMEKVRSLTSPFFAPLLLKSNRICSHHCRLSLNHQFFFEFFMQFLLF